MTHAEPSWTLHLARHQAPLDAVLRRIAAETGPERVVVVVRSRETEDRVRRMLPFPAQVVRLGPFLGAVSPAALTDDDILPAEVVHWLVRDALPAHHKDTRDHVADEYLRNIQLLAANGIRPPYPGPAQAHADAELEAVHAALLERLAPHNEAGRYAAFQRILVGHRGPSRFTHRFPGATRVVLFGIDWLSPAEELAIETLLKDVVDVDVLAVGRPPRRKGDADTSTTEWCALAHTDRLVRWAAHWRTAYHDLGTGAAPDDEDPDAAVHARREVLGRLYSLHPHDPAALPGAHTVRPGDPEAEVEETAARIHDRVHHDGMPPEDIGIIVPRLEDYAERLHDALGAHGIPATIRHEGSLHATPPGTLLALLLSDLEHGHERDRFLDLVAHPLFRYRHVGQDGERTYLNAPWLRKCLARRGLAPRGTAGWNIAFERLEKSEGDLLGGAAPAQSGDDPGDVEEVRSADDVRKDSAEPGGGQAPSYLQRQRDATLDLLLRLDAIAGAPDADGFFALLRTLLSDTALGRTTQRAMRRIDEPRHLARALDALLDLLDETQRAFRLHGKGSGRLARDALTRRLYQTPLPIEADRAWGVQIIGLRNAAGLRFKEVHLIGATADDLPPHRRPPRLQRILETRFGRGRLRRLDEDGEARRILYGLLSDTEGTVYLSAPREKEGTEQAPSVLLEELRDAYVIEPAPVPAAEVRTTQGLHRAAATTGATWHGAPVQLSSARALLTARNDPQDMGPYTGHLIDPAVRAATADHTLSGATAVSASRINRYARCAQHALWYDRARLRADEERDDDLSPLDKGRIVHKIIELWSHDLLARRGEPAYVNDTVEEERRLIAIATDVVSALQLDGLPWDAYKEELLGGLAGTHPYATRPPGLLKRFVADMARRDVGIVASEVSFGSKDAPLILDVDGRRIPLTGTIDRIEQHADGLQVLDLKTGNPPRRKDTLGGIDFQVPLYVLATQRLYPERPVALGGYYKLKRARKKETGLDQEIPGKKEDATVLEGLIEATPGRVRAMMEAEDAGHHPLTYLDEKDAKCAYCDHRLLCARRPHLTPRRRDAAAARGTSGGYVPERVLELAATPPDEETEDEA